MAIELEPKRDTFSFFLWLDEMRRAALLEACGAEEYEIGRALARFDNGTFGDCLQCGESIDREYLGTHPTAELCPDCQPGSRVIRIAPSIETLRTRLQEEGGRLLLTSREPTGPSTNTVARDFLEELAAGLPQSSRDRLDMVIAALERVDSGTYGQCVSCGERVGPERLETEPWVPQCEDCLPTPRVIPFRVRDEWPEAIAA